MGTPSSYIFSVQTFYGFFGGMPPDHFGISGAPNDNFRKNICSEDNLRSRIFETFCCKISCLPASPRIFEHLRNGIIAHF